MNSPHTAANRTRPPQSPIPKHERLVLAFADAHGCDYGAACDLVDALEVWMRYHTSRAEGRGFRRGLAVSQRQARRTA
jgi:hypothetical protein